MTRVPQPSGQRGSLRWMQQAVAQGWPSLEAPIRQQTGAAGLCWLSPLASDDFAEYRDGAFLDRIGHPGLKPALADFWPAGGPQWDALALTDAGDVLLVEAKAHVPEMFSPGTAARAASRARIERALGETARLLGARTGHADWSRTFYQLANRLAHLAFLRRHGVRAWLVLVGFVGDDDMGGPRHPESWRAALDTAFHALGLPQRHPMSAHVLHICPDVRDAA